MEASPAATHVGFGLDVDGLTARVTDGAEDVLAALDPGDGLGYELTEEDDALVDEAEVLLRPALPTVVEPRGGRV